MSVESYFAVVKGEQSAIDEADNNLLFCGKRLKFFNSILSETLEIEENKTNDIINDWSVTFFKDSPYAQTLALKVVHRDMVDDKSEFNQLNYGERELITAKVAIITSTSETNKAKHCENASWFVRASGTLNAQDLKELPNEWRQVDGRGMVLLQKFTNLDQAQRQILLLMLAIAYSQAFQQINQQIGQALKAPLALKDIEEIYQQAAIFNARYYFYNPVKLSNYPTYKCWQDIRDAYQLSVQNQELNEQVSQVHSILSHRQKLKDDVEKERWNKNITLVGAFLSAFGLIEAGDTLVDRFGVLVGSIVFMLTFLIVLISLWVINVSGKSKRAKS